MIAYDARHVTPRSANIVRDDTPRGNAAHQRIPLLEQIAQAIICLHSCREPRMQNLLSSSTPLPSVADAYLTLAMEAADMGAWQWDIRQNTVKWSSQLERMHGLEPGTFDGTFDAYQRDIHPEDRDHVFATISSSLQERQPHYLTYRIVRPDGEIRWLEARGKLFLGDDGQPERLVGVCMDITSKREHEEQWREARRQQEEAERALRDQTRLAQLSRDISLALTRTAPLPDVLQDCVTAVVTHLGAAFARIWTLNASEQVLELQASAGMYTHLNGPHSRVPVGQFKIGSIAQERRPHLTNDVQNDARVGDKDWARRQEMVAFAGYPLLVGDGLVGVLAMFAKHPLAEADFVGLGTVANALAVGIARARADEEMRASEERYRFLADATPTQVWTSDPGGRIDYMNSQARTYFGLDPTLLSAEQITELVHAEDRETARDKWTFAIAHGAPLEIEYRLRRHDGEYRWHIVRAQPFRDITGRVTKWFGTNTDVHDFKLVRLALSARAEELARIAAELEYQRDLTTTIMNNTASALFMIDTSGHPIFMNAAAIEMTGYSGLDEIKNRTLHDAVHFRKADGSPYPIEECPIDQANANIVPLRAQRETFCRKNGDLFPIEYNVAPITRAGRRLGAVIEARDITRELHDEAELRRRAESLAEMARALQRSNRDLDQFAYVASHDLKAPLRGIANLSQWIEEDLGSGVPEPTREHLKLLRSRVHRMEALIDGVLEYSRAARTAGQRESVPVRRVLREVIDLIAPPASIHFEVASDMPTLTTHRLPLQQVFMNLITNAVKYACVDRPDPRIEIGYRVDGGVAEFFVSDNGPGIAPPFHEKIWGIFQTLQPRDEVEGTGIGLALVKKIVESRGGRVWVESAAGQGATFRFTWPETAGETE
jgi:PAS domain S-box-containing protein